MFKLRIDIVHSQPHKNSKQKKRKKTYAVAKTRLISKILCG